MNEVVIEIDRWPTVEGNPVRKLGTSRVCCDGRQLAARDEAMRRRGTRWTPVASTPPAAAAAWPSRRPPATGASSSSSAAIRSPSTRYVSSFSFFLGRVFVAFPTVDRPRRNRYHALLFVYQFFLGVG